MSINQNLKQIPKPTLTDLLDLKKREIMAQTNCVQIGVIKAFDAATQTASVQIALKKVIDVKPDGTRVLEEYSLLLKCPVFFLYGGAGFLTMPVAEGDNCILLFNDREIDNWFTDGVQNGPVAPTSFRVHDLSDGIALVGLRNVTNFLQNYIKDGVRLAFGDSSFTLKNGVTDLVTSVFNVSGILNAGELHAANGATGTFNIVTVVDGIVTGGS